MSSVSFNPTSNSSPGPTLFLLNTSNCLVLFHFHSLQPKSKSPTLFPRLLQWLMISWQPFWFPALQPARGFSFSKCKSSHVHLSFRTLQRLPIALKMTTELFLMTYKTLHRLPRPLFQPLFHHSSLDFSAPLEYLGPSKMLHLLPLTVPSYMLLFARTLILFPNPNLPLLFDNCQLNFYSSFTILSSYIFSWGNYL